ncbi:MAG: hypothetical protein WAT41_16010, partial [Flavobacteriales bacterium]
LIHANLRRGRRGGEGDGYHFRIVLEAYQDVMRSLSVLHENMPKSVHRKRNSLDNSYGRIFNDHLFGLRIHSAG